MIAQLDVFTGRASELIELKKVYQQSIAGKAQLCIISGQGGIGKTSLLQEFSNKIREDQSLPVVVFARCDSIARAKTPYHVLGQLLPALLAYRASGKEDENNVRIGKNFRASGGLLKKFGPDLLEILLPSVSNFIKMEPRLLM